ncbi:MAG TPA: hypothetical protein VIL37_11605 [Natronosporangium sp.]
MSGAPIKVTIEDDRIFVPLVERGCGVGCRYCYISAPQAEIQAISPIRLRELLDSLTSSGVWRTGPEGPLIAIGHDTEFAGSAATIANALACLDFARHHRLPLQLATKFPLSAADPESTGNVAH